jgi:hypothetical protein
MRFEVLTAVNMLTGVFWVVAPCGIEGDYHRFGVTYRLRIHGRNLYCKRTVCCISESTELIWMKFGVQGPHQKSLDEFNFDPYRSNMIPSLHKAKSRQLLGDAVKSRDTIRGPVRVPRA